MSRIRVCGSSREDEGEQRKGRLWDDVLITNETESWVLFYYHEDEFHFGLTKRALHVTGAAMSFMFELCYRSPEDKAWEAQILADVSAAGGRLDYREPAENAGGPICLTFEFESREQAESVAAALRERGEHVEGVCDYG